jgi:hypothetical protein
VYERWNLANEVILEIENLDRRKDDQKSFLNRCHFDIGEINCDYLFELHIMVEDDLIDLSNGRCLDYVIVNLDVLEETFGDAEIIENNFTRQSQRPDHEVDPIV